MASRPGVTAVIAGAKWPQQVEGNVRAAEVVGHAKIWDVVDRIAARHGGVPR